MSTRRMRFAPYVAALLLALLAALFPAIAYAAEPGGSFDSPDALIGLGAAVPIIPVLVAHIKPALRPLFARFTSDHPWELVADLVGIGWAFGLASSSYGPEWLSGTGTIILAGIALGVASGFARDGTQAALASATRKPPQEPATRGYVEPGAVGPGASV